MAGEVHYETFPSGDGEFRWRKRDANGQIIATSHETFVDEHNAYEAAENDRRTPHDAPIDRHEPS